MKHLRLRKTNIIFNTCITFLVVVSFIIIMPCVCYADIPEESAAIDEVVVEEVAQPIEVLDEKSEIQEVLAADGSTPDEIEAVEVEFLNTVDDNAIQLAVNAALAGADGKETITSVTIVVEAGTYDGITISNEGDVYDLAEDFVLNIVARDAVVEDAGETTYTNASGDVKISSEINIVGIDVLLAGLYLVTDSIVKAKNADVEIAGTIEDDDMDVNLSHGASVNIDAGEGNDDITLSGGDGNLTAEVEIVVCDIAGGQGDDKISVDTSATEITNGLVVINIEGNEGADQLELTGELEPTAPHTGVRTGLNNENADFTVVASNSQVLKVNATSVEAYTDKLENKNTVALSGQSIYSEALASFTDYILDYQNSTNVSIINTADPSMLPFLSSLIVNGEHIVIDSISAPLLNIVIGDENTEDIIVYGDIIGKNINISVVDTDVQFSIETSFASQSTTEVTFSIFDFYTDAFILIEETASLNATETITLSAYSSQTEPLVPDISKFNDAIDSYQAVIDDVNVGGDEKQAAQDKIDELQAFLINPNFVNVKIGSATITILGNITAGAGIKIMSEAIVEMEVSNADLAGWYIPLGVNVAVTESYILIKGAIITALAGSIDILSNTDVSMKTTAVTGEIPFSLALSIVVVDSKIDIVDDVTASQIVAQVGRILLITNGTTNVETIAMAEQDPEEDTSSGGFFAISIVIQEVASQIKGNTYIYTDEVVIESTSSSPDCGSTVVVVSISPLALSMPSSPPSSMPASSAVRASNKLITTFTISVSEKSLSSLVGSTVS